MRAADTAVVGQVRAVELPLIAKRLAARRRHAEGRGEPNSVGLAGWLPRDDGDNTQYGQGIGLAAAATSTVRCRDGEGAGPSGRRHPAQDSAAGQTQASGQAPDAAGETVGCYTAAGAQALAVSHPHHRVRQRGLGQGNGWASHGQRRHSAGYRAEGVTDDDRITPRIGR